MYKINTQSNDVIKLEQRLFKDLNIRERENLQEWIAKNPEMLGEEILIIQKEFDGFNDTNERLDLLAIDKNGGLVVIENKLDDSGRDVVWQALKYASYCSTLTSSQIVKIYQNYLDKWGKDEDATENLVEFLEIEGDELLLNMQDQRIIFVANNFRKEVTSTVLWLLDHDVNIQCFRAIPYSMDQEVFLQIEQIIPLPETHEFMIDAKEKEKEIKDKSKAVEESNKRLVSFWGQLKQTLEANDIDHLNQVSAKPYYNIGFWKGKGKFSYCIGKSEFRVELIVRNDLNKLYFDALYERRAMIEEKMAGEIIWERKDQKKSWRIKHAIPGDTFEGDFDSYRQDLCEWYMTAMSSFYEAIYPSWSDLTDSESTKLI